MKIVIATYDDWDALYIDGLKKNEDHILYACDIIDALGGDFPCTIDSIEMRHVDGEWWFDGDRDSYPDKIEDVVFEE